jgi:hypothetical protein
MGEVWKKISHIPGYEVSNFGQVRSLDTPNGKRGRILKPNLDKVGYPCVYPTVGLKNFTCRIHHLVAQEFIGPRKKGVWVLHSDGNQKNNNAKNLRYGTPKENCADRKAHGNEAIGQKSGKAKLSDESIQYIKDNAHRYYQRELGKLLNVSHTTIWQVLSGRTWSHLSEAA